MSIVQVIDQPTIDRIVASVMPKNATEADRLALATMMQSYNLNPLRKEVYPISYGGRLSIVVGVDGWRRLAHETGRYAGGEAAYGLDAEGRVDSCTYTVLTKDGGRFSFTCWLDEFRQGTPTWHKSPRHMLRIKAEVHCLKAAFGLAGPTEYDAEAEAAVPAAANARPASSAGVGERRDSSVVGWMRPASSITDWIGEMSPPPMSAGSQPGAMSPPVNIEMSTWTAVAVIQLLRTCSARS